MSGKDTKADESLDTVNALIGVMADLFKHSGANLVECAQASGVMFISTLALLSAKTGMTYSALCEDMGITGVGDELAVKDSD